jgi:hypothetical protein
VRSDTRAFIIRIWHEALNRDGSIRLWRGSIEHVNTGRRLHFRDLLMAMRFIEQESGIEAEQTRPSAQNWNWRLILTWLKNKLNRP